MILHKVWFAFIASTLVFIALMSALAYYELRHIESKSHRDIRFARIAYMQWEYALTIITLQGILEFYF